MKMYFTLILDYIDLKTHSMELYKYKILIKMASLIAWTKPQNRR